MHIHAHVEFSHKSAKSTMRNWIYTVYVNGILAYTVSSVHTKIQYLLLIHYFNNKLALCLSLFILPKLKMKFYGILYNV